MRSSIRRLFPAISTSVLVASLLLGPVDATAGTVTFTLDPPTLQSLLRAVTPYEVVIGKKGISETLTLSNPRDVRFEGGKIRVRIDCRGTPLPIEDVLEPAMSIQWNDTKKVYEAKIESLSVSIPAFGTYDLAQYVRPIEIPQVFSQLAGQGEEFLSVDGKILSLKVLDAMIQVSADVTFRKAPAGAQPIPAASKAQASGR